MIYPVVFWPGSYGSVVCHFINLHRNFYQVPTAFSINDTGIARQLDGPLHVDKDLNLVLNKKSPRPISKSTQDAILNNYDIAVKSQVPHQVLDADASTTKPIVIIPDLEHLHHRSNQNNPHRVIDAPNRKEYKQWLLEIKGYNHYKLHINDFWNWGKMRDPNNLDESYLNFCKYLNTEPRPTAGLDITRIDWFVRP
jgi:hypothetical protein